MQAAGTVNDSGGNWTIFDASGGGTVNDSNSGNWTIQVTTGGGTVNDSGGANWTVYAYFAEEPAIPTTTGGGGSSSSYVPPSEVTTPITPSPVITNPIINWLNTPVIDFTVPPPPSQPHPLFPAEVLTASPLASLLPTSPHIVIKVWQVILIVGIISALGVGIWFWRFRNG